MSEKKKFEENGLEIKIYWESTVSLGDLIKLCQFIDKNPLGAAFTVEIEGKDDVIRT